MNDRTKAYLWIAVGLCFFLAIFISPWASSSPDGLERVAEDQGFLKKAEEPGTVVWEHAPVADYAMPGITNESVATAVAGGLGVLGTLCIGWGLAHVLRRKPTSA